MRRASLLVVIALCALAAGPQPRLGSAGGRRGEALAAPSPPSTPAPPSPLDPRDRLLYERALRVGRAVSRRHVSPEGVLAYIHRPGATPEQLSHDALLKADTAIWTGCYAASVACR